MIRLVALLLLAGPAEGTPLPAAAVFPMDTKALPDGGTASALLTNILAQRLAGLQTYRIISADEVNALVEHEAERQGMGCSDEECLTELAGALGARFVISGEVHPVGSSLQWTVGVLDNTEGKVVRRASANGADLQALASQAEDVALTLCGREAETRGAMAATRYGFTSKGDYESFASERASRPSASPTEVLTDFILARNTESTALAVAQAAVFLLAGMLAAPGLGLMYASYNLAPSWPVLGLLVCLGSCFGCGSVVASLAGVGLLVVDALDLRRVTVKRKGCCRDDARIMDARGGDGVRTAAAIAVLVSGPLAQGAAISLLLMSVTGVALGDRPITGPKQEIIYYWDAAALVSYVALSFCALPVVTLAVAIPAVVGGAFLLLRPDRDAVEEE